MDPRHRRAAVFAHYREVPRREGEGRGEHRRRHDARRLVLDDPVRGRDDSVGVVAEGVRVREQGLAPEAALDQANRPLPRRAAADGARATDVARLRGQRLDLRLRRLGGEGYLLVGDAGAFIESGLLERSPPGDVLRGAGRRSARCRPEDRRSAPVIVPGVRADGQAARARLSQDGLHLYGPAFPSLCFIPSAVWAWRGRCSTSSPATWSPPGGPLASGAVLSDRRAPRQAQARPRRAAAPRVRRARSHDLGAASGRSTCTFIPTSATSGILRF